MPPSSPGPKNDRVEAIVTVAAEDVHRIGTIAKALTRKGFNVSHMLENSGLITGTAEPASFEKLRKTKGVAALEVSGDVSLPTPGSAIQ
jgi:hypothetical protein